LYSRGSGAQPPSEEKHRPGGCSASLQLLFRRDEFPLVHGVWGRSSPWEEKPRPGGCSASLPNRRFSSCTRGFGRRSPPCEDNTVLVGVLLLFPGKNFLVYTGVRGGAHPGSCSASLPKRRVSSCTRRVWAEVPTLRRETPSWPPGGCSASLPKRRSSSCTRGARRAKPTLGREKRRAGGTARRQNWWPAKWGEGLGQATVISLERPDVALPPPHWSDRSTSVCDMPNRATTISHAIAILARRSAENSALGTIA
jgi:hypothetical protein